MRFFALDNEPTSGTRRTATSTRRRSPTTRSGSGPWTTRRRSRRRTRTRSSSGPVPWGWCAYFWSALDGCGDGGPDLAGARRRALPRVVPAAGARLRAAHGVRLVDYLDVHYYPQASGVALSDDESPSPGAAAALAEEPLRPRLRRRVLDRRLLRRPVELIPRMKELDRRALSGNEARDHRVQLGQRQRHQLRARAGRGARDLRARGRRPRRRAGSRPAPAAASRTPSGSTSTTTGRAPPSRATASRPSSSDVDDVGAYAVAGRRHAALPPALQQGHRRPRRRRSLRRRRSTGGRGSGASTARTRSARPGPRAPRAAP